MRNPSCLIHSADGIASEIVAEIRKTMTWPGAGCPGGGDEAACPERAADGPRPAGLTGVQGGSPVSEAGIGGAVVARPGAVR